MGLFDFFKDGDDYEGTHDSRRQHKPKVAPSIFDNNFDLIDWLETNKVILLSEKEGLIVYTNKQDQSFLQLYSQSKEVTDEKIDEYVEVSAQDIRDLLKEMPYISYLVLNPSSDNFLIKREEFLSSAKNDREDDKETPIQPEVSTQKSESNLEADKEDQVDFFSDETKIFSLTDKGLVEAPASKETGVENQPNNEIDSEPLEDERVELEVIPTPIEAEEINSIHLSELSEISELNKERTLEKGDLMTNFEPVTQVSQQLIRRVLDYANDGIEKYYVAKEVSTNKVFLFVDTFDELAVKPELDFVTLTRTADQAQELAHPSFLLYDLAASREIATHYSDMAVLDFFKSNPIIFTLPQNAKVSELSSFTDLSQIPSLFLEAFEKFEIAKRDQFAEYLQAHPAVEMVQVNPFTEALFLKPEAFQSQVVEVAVVEESRQLVIEITSGKESLIEILTILKKFKLTNIEISDNESEITLNFASKKDVVIARQILKLKTDFTLK